MSMQTRFVTLQVSYDSASSLLPPEEWPWREILDAYADGMPSVEVVHADSEMAPDLQAAHKRIRDLHSLIDEIQRPVDTGW
jgi:hypothetical protein